MGIILTALEHCHTQDGENQMTKIEYPDMTVDLKQNSGDIIRRVAKVRFNKMETPVEKEISSYDVIVNGQILSRYNSNPAFASGSGSNSNNASRQEFYHYDHNNNLALITDRSGNIQWKNLMDAYGNVLPLPDSSENKEALTLSSNLLTGGAGVFYIQRAKMFNMRRRFYTSLLRRFKSIDPIYFRKHYVYAGNNPIVSSDPSGLLEFTIGSITDSSGLPGLDVQKRFGYLPNFILGDRINKAIAIIKNSYNLLEWTKILNCYCKKEVKVEDIKNLILKIEYDFTYVVFHNFAGTVSQKTNERTKGKYQNIFWLSTGFFALPSNLAAAVLVHELGHHFICGISDNKQDHICCDYLAYLLLAARSSQNPDSFFSTQEDITLAIGDIRESIENWDQLRSKQMLNALSSIGKVDRDINERTNKNYSIEEFIQQGLRNVEGNMDLHGIRAFESVYELWKLRTGQSYPIGSTWDDNFKHLCLRPGQNPTK